MRLFKFVILTVVATSSFFVQAREKAINLYSLSDVEYTRLENEIKRSGGERSVCFQLPEAIRLDPSNRLIVLSPMNCPSQGSDKNIVRMENPIAFLQNFRKIEHDDEDGLNLGEVDGMLNHLSINGMILEYILQNMDSPEVGELAKVVSIDNVLMAELGLDGDNQAVKDYISTIKLILLYAVILPASGAKAVEEMIFDLTGKRIIILPEEYTHIDLS